MSAELFARVQAVLDERLPSPGERQRRHHHYLKGMLWRGRCHDKGVDSRLLLTKVKGHGGEYWYFFCSARQEHACDAPYIRIEDAETGVLRHYASLRLPEGFADRVREVLADTLADEERSIRMVHEHLTKRLTALEAKEENLLDLVEDGGAVAAKVRTRLMAIGEERERVKSELADQGPLLEVGAALIRPALDLLDDPQELYRQTSDPVRRQLNQVFFNRLYLDTDEVTDDRLALPFNDFLYRRSLKIRRVVHTRVHKTSTPNGARWDAAGGISAGAALLDRISRGEGSSTTAMVELARLYSNPEAEARRLRRVQSAASSPRPADGSRQPRQHQRRLSMTEATELIKEYEQQASIKELAQRFGIHRLTVIAHLRRHRVELRRTGLSPTDVPAAATLYCQGWSCARLGERFGVDATTVWRNLRAANVAMRSPSQRRSRIVEV